MNVIGIIVGICLIIGSVSYVTSLNNKISKLESENQSLNAAIAINLKNVKACNDSVKDLQDQAKKRTEDATKALEAAQAEAKKNQNKATVLLEAKPKTDNLCKEANDLFTDYLKDE